MNCPEVQNDGDDRAVLVFQSPTPSLSLTGPPLSILKVTGTY